jgi:pimeloyl-ACP methyl ester carboxylesterase
MRYDEFALLHENASEHGLPWSRPPLVRREAVRVADGRTTSAIVWGDGDPEIVLVHGGSQNAHTWDTVALALDRPVLCIDLPGHGHSDWRDDHDYWPWTLAPDVATVVRALAPAARVLCGMSLGGLTAIAAAAADPTLARRLVIVDVTPGATDAKGAAIGALVAGPKTFASFDELLRRTVAHNPTRSVSSLRRGVLHNAVEQPDGSWAWRYDRPVGHDGPADTPHYTALWDDLARIPLPVLLVRGSTSPVVTDDDVAELRRRRPDARVVVVEGAGHSVQGDRPLELASLLRDELGNEMDGA